MLGFCVIGLIYCIYLGHRAYLVLQLRLKIIEVVSQTSTYMILELNQYSEWENYMTELMM